MRRCPLFLLVALAGCGPADADKPVEIGHACRPGAIGDDELALKLAVEELNLDPSRQPQKRRLWIRHASGGSLADEWGAQATRFVALNQVKALIGGGRPAEAEKIGVAVQGDEAIALCTAGWAGGSSRNLFTLGIAPAERGRVLAIVAKESQPKSVVVIREASSKSANLAADRFVADLRGSGFAMGEVDVSAAEKPVADVVFLACSASVAMKHRPKIATTVLFGDDDSELSALLAAGPAADGIHVATAFHPGIASERMTAFATRFQQAHGRAPGLEAMLAHDALTIWVEAARRANGYDSGPLRDELLKRDRPFETLTGPLTFADDHTARRPIFVGRIRSGQFSDLKQFEPIR